MTTPSILIVEDHFDIAETIQLYLTQAKLASIHLSEGRQVLSTIESQVISLVLLDIMLPDCNGVTLCKQIRKCSKVPIIMLTAKSTEQDIILGLEAGADDYITKPFRPKELLARVKSMLRRTADFSESNCLIYAELMLDLESRSLEIDGRHIALTKSEFLILEYFMLRQGRVITRGQIIDRVFGHAFNASDRAIDSHLYNLRKKIENNNRQYIHTVHGIGYKMSSSASAE